MKTLLLSAICVLISVALWGQNEGHTWKFAVGTSSPFMSTAAIENSPSRQLLQLGNGTVVTGVSDNIGLGTSCSVNQEVATFTTGTGFEFINDNGSGEPIVRDSWTLEMVVKFDVLPNDGWVRLAGFKDVSQIADESQQGFYISEQSKIIFFHSPNLGEYAAFNDGHTLTADTWYHIIITRNNNNSRITLYVNGNEVGFIADIGKWFVPEASNNFNINFIKDEGYNYGNPPLYDESSGSVYKLSVFNRSFSSVDAVNRFATICSDEEITSSNNSRGLEWKFTADPLPATHTAVAAGGTLLASDLLTLDVIGAGNFVSIEDDLSSFSASCAPPSIVGSYDAGVGFTYNNTPLFIQNDYTIEMTVKLINSNDYIRLFGFNDLNDPGPQSDYGIYLNQDGIFNYVFPFEGQTAGLNSPPLVTDVAQWNHYTFTRSTADKKIKIYVNGLFVHEFDDAMNAAVAQTANNYALHFLKDNTAGDNPNRNTEGHIYKIALFNTALPEVYVQQRYDNLCGAIAIPLPVRLVNFTADKNASSVQVKWTTSSEQNNAGYEILRSGNGTDFTSIGFVEGKGSTNETSSYAFVDNTPLPGLNHYRLKQKDFSGEVSYSHIKTVDFSKSAQEIKLFPNPARSVITVTQLKAGDRLSIFNNQGALISRKNVANAQETISIESLPQGVYLLQVMDSKNQSKVIRFTKL